MVQDPLGLSFLEPWKGDEGVKAFALLDRAHLCEGLCSGGAGLM
jgi:hypothetical protein